MVSLLRRLLAVLDTAIRCVDRRSNFIAAPRRQGRIGFSCASCTFLAQFPGRCKLTNTRVKPDEVCRYFTAREPLGQVDGERVVG